ncbi:MAG: PQQ-dependent sugar dehydrogenase [Halieaceae bacterium]
MKGTIAGRLSALCILLLLAIPLHAADYKLDTIAEGFEYPWSITFLPGGELLVTQRGGQLLRVSADGSQRKQLNGVPATYVAGQGGFFDVVLHPDFADNNMVYLSFAHGTPAANATRIVRGTLAEDGLENVEVILTVEPFKDTPQHYGGRFAFLPDGTLLLTTGDGFEYREKAQDPSVQFGKTLRVNDDGSVPADNPFAGAGDASAKVWTYGHRNPQGIVVDQDTGAVYLHEHGPRGGDELNLLQPGSNYGWPAITYGLDYSGAYVSPFTEHAGMEQPLWHWVPSIAPAGMTWYDGDAFPQWRGDLFVTALVDKEVRRLDLEDGKIVSETPLFSEIGERLRDIRTAPDGSLYILTDSEAGKIVRVSPAR